MKTASQLAAAAGFGGNQRNTLAVKIERLIELSVAEEREACVKACEADIVNRPSDHVANYFDGGLRHCASAIQLRNGIKRPR